VLLGYFLLSKETWWIEYFAPLEKLIAKFQAKYTDDPEVLEQLRQAHGELDTFRQYPQRNSSVYFILKRNIK
jgi:hypothetical protein